MADTPVNRRAFFSQGFRRVLSHAVETVNQRAGSGMYTRPPGALPEATFLAACTRCGECERVCPVQAIHMLGTGTGLAAGTPALNVNLRSCVMCVDMPCAAICPTDALEVPATMWADVRLAHVEINEGECVAFRGVECGVCARTCPVGERALSLDASGRPVIGAECTGCGVCINACVTTPSSIIAHPLGAAA
jgi:ferredoxin-type protein NapG